jgi:hypothetical protein
MEPSAIKDEINGTHIMTTFPRCEVSAHEVWKFLSFLAFQGGRIDHLGAEITV